MIEIKNISKSFGEKEVLKDISFKFHRGKVNMIIGQSGSGKSVLTKCIVGLLTPDSGEVFYDTKNFFHLDDDEVTKIRTHIGMLFQASALFDSMTVEQNVSFPLTMFTDMSKEEIQNRANECIERVNLAGTNHLYPSETSGGMQKRIAIARAISMKPKYLFCDEPNSGLDPQTSIVIDNLIKDITEEMDITTIVITHDMNSVIEVADNIMFIHKGQKWWEGSREEILASQNKELNDFVYASNFMKTVREKLR